MKVRTNGLGFLPDDEFALDYRADRVIRSIFPTFEAGVVIKRGGNILKARPDGTLTISVHPNFCFDLHPWRKLK